MTASAAQLGPFIFQTYILPARSRGDATVIIPVRRVWKDLDGRFQLGQIQGVLGSMLFRNTYHLTIVEDDYPVDPPEDYVFKL
ncbi:MAG TPA: hypothetical protein VJV74_15645 [Terriglobia bacterium]|nr:hypothetical protein [Terriglobia bacterium]